jgi:hypothetical protein
MNNRQFISDVQKFTAVSAVGVSALRGQGAGVIGRIREKLGALDLSQFKSHKDASVFSSWLDNVTEGLARDCRVKWGAARKALNLFLRDCLYSKYLCPTYQLIRQNVRILHLMQINLIIVV